MASARDVVGHVVARVVNSRETLTAAFAHQVEDFDDREDDADQAGDHHEDGEDPLLGGPRDKAVHHVRAGLLLALDE